MDDREYLMKCVKKAEDELKKKAFPRVHKRFVYLDELKFEWKDYLTSYALGSYSSKEETIYVNKRLLDEVKNRNRINRKIVDTIKHELIHYFVSEWFDRYRRGSHNFCGDTSPIFLSMLCWLCPNKENGYRAFRDFKKSEMYKKIMEFEDFHKLFIYLKNMVYEYVDVFIELKIEEGNATYFSNDFMFNQDDRRGMFIKLSQKLTCKPNSQYKEIKTNFFMLGYDVMPKDVKRLYNRKKYNSNRFLHK